MLYELQKTSAHFSDMLYLERCAENVMEIKNL
nr:MAG TPA: hypothetical protein [Caudoviricetes sp.]